MKEPKIPGPTCRTIDQVIRCIDDAVNSEELGDRQGHACHAKDNLEEIRTANEQLRAAVVHWQELAGDRLLRIEQLEEKVDSLEADLAEKDGGE
jgi:hypothetical protein